MGNLKNILSWAGLIFLGLVMGVLEDLLFVTILVPNVPPSWDLTGDLFFTFTVPFAQLIALAITGTIAWFFLGLRQTPRLVTFWLCWCVARATFLAQVFNPVQDIMIYLAWITLWCALIGVAAHFTSKPEQAAGAEAG